MLILQKASAYDEKRGFAHQFTCPHEDCEDPDHTMQIGKGRATALSGFIAGVIVALIILLPALYLFGKLYPIGILSSGGS